MTRSVRAQLDFVIGEVGLSRIQIKVHADNLRSRAIPERLGLQLEGLLRNGGTLHGKPCDYAILRYHQPGVGYPKPKLIELASLMSDTVLQDVLSYMTDRTTFRWERKLSHQTYKFLRDLWATTFNYNPGAGVIVAILVALLLVILRRR